MSAVAESARPLEALGRVLSSVDAARNGRAWYALLLALATAGLLLACADVALTATRIPLPGPALFGLLLPAAVLLLRHVRQRLVFVALPMGALIGLAALVGALASLVVVADGRAVSTLAVLAAGVEAPPKLLMAGLFGRGLRSLGATPIPAGASPHVGAALVGGDLVFMLALALPTLVYLRGTCSLYLALQASATSEGPD